VIEQMKKVIFRWWLYFRVGHGTYFSYLMGFAQWVIVIYTLFIVSNPLLHSIFDHLTIFVLTFALIYPWIAIAAGFIHYKKSPAFRSEVEVGAEANIYTYKIFPESKEDRLIKFQILQTETMYAFFKKQGILTPIMDEEWQDYIDILTWMKNGKDVRYFRKCHETEKENSDSGN
jgi:hypothetical protein